MRPVRERLGGPVAVAATAVCLACAPQDSPGIRTEPSARRIVSLVPSVTDWIVALGVADRLVGRTRYDTAAILREIPSVGGMLDPSIELLVSLAPDLVLVGTGTEAAATRASLRRLGVRTHPVAVETIGDVHGTLTELGRLLDVAPPAAVLQRRVAEALAVTRGAYADRVRVRVLYVVWASPPITAGAGTFIDELITIAGGENVFRDAPAAWPPVTYETIVARDPDIIVWPQGLAGVRSVEELARRPGWAKVPAVGDGRVVFVAGHLFERPGPNLMVAAAELARHIHD